MTVLKYIINIRKVHLLEVVIHMFIFVSLCNYNATFFVLIHFRHVHKCVTAYMFIFIWLSHYNITFYTLIRVFTLNISSFLTAGVARLRYWSNLVRCSKSLRNTVIKIRLLAGAPRNHCSVPDRGKYCYQVSQTGAGTHPASCSLDSGQHFPGYWRNRGI
jgi:hypothetical protein